MYLIELAALVASSGERIIRGGQVSEAAVQQYWVTSKQRFDAWTKSLLEYALAEHHASLAVSNTAERLIARQTARDTVHEILVSEVLTRVWSAIACASDLRRQAREVDPIIRSVFHGHQEFRHQALNLMLQGRSFNPQESVALNRLRQRSEKWSDLLLGYVGVGEGAVVLDFAFDAERVREFSLEIRELPARPMSGLAWQLVVSSLRLAFRESIAWPNETLNQQVASAILANFPPDLFDSTGQLGSLWIDRLQCSTSDTMGMIEDLLRDEPPPPRHFLTSPLGRLAARPAK